MSSSQNGLEDYGQIFQLHLKEPRRGLESTVFKVCDTSVCECALFKGQNEALALRMFFSKPSQESWMKQSKTFLYPAPSFQKMICNIFTELHNHINLAL